MSRPRNRAVQCLRAFQFPTWQPRFDAATACPRVSASISQRHEIPRRAPTRFPIDPRNAARPFVARSVRRRPWILLADNYLDPAERRRSGSGTRRDAYRSRTRQLVQETLTISPLARETCETTPRTVPARRSSDDFSVRVLRLTRSLAHLTCRWIARLSGSVGSNVRGYCYRYSKVRKHCFRAWRR